MRLPALTIMACSALAGCVPTDPVAPPATPETNIHGAEHDVRSGTEQTVEALAPEAAPAPDRQAILNVGRKLIGTTEATGRNDGPVIEAIQRSAGIGKGDPYCAAFNYWCYRETNNEGLVPRSGWSPDWVSKPTWKQGAGRSPRPADAFGIYFASKGRVAHTGLVEVWGESSAVTLEGNTSPAASMGSSADRNGDGIWRKRRLTSQIHSVRDWIGP